MNITLYHRHSMLTIQLSRMNTTKAIMYKPVVLDMPNCTYGSTTRWLLDVRSLLQSCMIECDTCHYTTAVCQVSHSTRPLRVRQLYSIMIMFVKLYV